MGVGNVNLGIMCRCGILRAIYLGEIVGIAVGVSREDEDSDKVAREQLVMAGREWWRSE
jgi:hypothetical protein